MGLGFSPESGVKVQILHPIPRSWCLKGENRDYNNQ